MARAKDTYNTTGLIPFKKGDARINKKGRPHSHDILKKRIQEIGEQAAKGGSTELDALILRLYRSRFSRDRALLLRHGWGDPKEVDLKVSGGDVDAAILAELARVAGRREAEDAGTAQANADASSSDSGLATAPAERPAADSV